MSQEFIVCNYVNFINIFNDKELLALNYSKLNAFIYGTLCLIHYLYFTVSHKMFSTFIQ